MAWEPPEAPADLANPGRDLWQDVVSDIGGDWSLDARELHLLARACRCQDEMVQLEEAVDRDGATCKGSRGQTVVHPALSEARQLRLVQLRLLTALETEDPDSDGPEPVVSRRGRKAADARYERKADVAATRRRKRGTPTR